MATAIKAIPATHSKMADAMQVTTADTQYYSHEVKSVGDDFQDFENSTMPCCLSEEELDKEIYLSMRSGNATQDEVNAVFGR